MITVVVNMLGAGFLWGTRGNGQELVSLYNSGMTDPVSPPPATGARLEWAALPERIRAAVEAWLGSAVVSAATQASGFSPGVAARLQTADGRRVFVKAVGPEPNPTSPTIHRQEARILPCAVRSPVARTRLRAAETRSGQRDVDDHRTRLGAPGERHRQTHHRRSLTRCHPLPPRWP